MRLHPGPFTLRELFEMEEGHGRDEWARTASIIATIAESNRDTKKRTKPYEASDFNPYKDERKNQIVEIDGKAGFEVLKSVFVKG